MERTRFLDGKLKGAYDEDELMNTLYTEMFIVAYSKMNNKADGTRCRSGVVGQNIKQYRHASR